MVTSLLVLAAFVGHTADDIPSSLLGRSLSWDPQGLVPFSATGQLSDTERGWIDLMKQGDYSHASAAAAHQCQTRPSFFAIWVVAESARVRKETRELDSLVSQLTANNETSPFTRYATFRLISLLVAQTPSGHFEGRKFIQNPDYPPLTKKLHEAWLACQPAGEKNLAVAAALATGSESPQAMRDVALSAFKAAKEPQSLLLWKARAQMLGRWAAASSLATGQLERDQKGRIRYFFMKGNEPDMDGSADTLKQYHAKVPSDPKYFFYHARWLCWDAFFFTEKDLEKKNKLAEAVADMRRFSEANDQPPPLVESARRFLRKPDPGAFNTPVEE